MPFLRGGACEAMIWSQLERPASFTGALLDSLTPCPAGSIRESAWPLAAPAGETMEQRIARSRHSPGRLDHEYRDGAQRGDHGCHVVLESPTGHDDQALAQGPKQG